MGKKSRKTDGARCRRHPRLRQGAGVCAPCLRERLSHLSASASLPTVVRRGGRGGEEASSCSEASTMYSSTEGSTGASSASASGSASPWAEAFHRETRRGAVRLSLLMRHERVVMDGDEVVRRKQRARRSMSFWGKLLHATRGGGGKEDGCSLAHSKTLDVGRSTAAKWILF